MVPAALPAFSAPIGVRVVPSWLISDWDRLCAATALATRLRARPQAPMNVFCICILFSPKTGLEAYAEADSGEVAVNQGVVLAIKEVGVTDAGVVLVGVVRVQADADRLGIFHKVGAVTLNVMGPGDVRAQVDTGNHVAVIQGRTQTVTPGEVGEVAIVFTPTVAVRIGSVLRVAGAIRALALAKQRVTTIFGHTHAALHATDVVGTHFTHQGQTTGAQHTINGMHSSHGSLPGLPALVALQVRTRCCSLVTTPARIARSSHLSDGSTTQVTGIDLDRHVRTVAEFTGDGHASDVGTKADAVQTNILRMFKEVATGALGTINTGNGLLPGCSQTAFDVGINRATAVVVQRIETELSIVQSRHEPAESDTELAAVTGFLVFARPHDVARLACCRSCQTGMTRGQITCALSRGGKDQTVVTATGGNVGGGEEGATVVRHGAMPLELVKGFHGQVFGQALGQVEHLDRLQSFLQLCARTAESGGVNRVDGVDAVLDEDTLAPADHLAAQTDVTGILADGVVVIDKGVQQLDTGTLLQRVTTGVIDIVETLAAVLGFEVVPVVATDKSTGVAVTQLQVVGTLENLGEHIAFLVVQATIVGGTSCCVTVTDVCVSVIQALVPIRHGHTRADRQLGIQLRINFADIETDCIGRT